MNYDNFKLMLIKYVDDKKKDAEIIAFKENYSENTLNNIKEKLDQKLNHTLRVVDNVIELAKKLNMHINYEKIVFDSGLFHDIGRFNQAVLNQGNFVDRSTFKKPIDGIKFNNHGDYGAHLLQTNPEEIELLDNIVDENVKPAIITTTELHQKDPLPEPYNNYRLDDKLRNTDPNSILTGSFRYNECEIKIITVLLQMIMDADKMDILYQRTTREIPPFKNIIKVKNTGNLNEIANRWGVSLDTIYKNNDINNLGEDITIPRESIPVEKLFVNPSLMERMKRMENIDLKTLQNEDDYTFITALWWSIYTFLKNINFVGNLKIIEDSQVLEKIYNIYPDSYQPLIDEIFKFAKETLIEERLYNNQDEIYINQTK